MQFLDIWREIWSQCVTFDLFDKFVQDPSHAAVSCQALSQHWQHLLLSAHTGANVWRAWVRGCMVTPQPYWYEYTWRIGAQEKVQGPCHSNFNTVAECKLVLVLTYTHKCFVVLTLAALGNCTSPYACPTHKILCHRSVLECYWSCARLTAFNKASSSLWGFA